MIKVNVILLDKHRNIVMEDLYEWVHENEWLNNVNSTLGDPGVITKESLSGFKYDRIIRRKYTGLKASGLNIYDGDLVIERNILGDSDIIHVQETEGGWNIGGPNTFYKLVGNIYQKEKHV